MKYLFLNDFHASKGAKFSPFADWSMPISYKGAVEEHLKTRNGAAIFDVSHMGEILVHGKEAVLFLNRVITNNVEICPIGRGIYSTICNVDGGTLDDLICYRQSNETFFLCVNASNVKADYLHLRDKAKEFECTIENVSAAYGQFAIQGPKSKDILVSIFGEKILQLEKMECRHFIFGDKELFIARTGYTGEDGFEIYIKTQFLEELAMVFEEFCLKGRLTWAGLAARDTLRLEAGFPLYGHELNWDISPLQAGISWCIDWNKGEFEGRTALLKEKMQPRLKSKVLFFEVLDRRIPRTGAKIIEEENQIGRVLSGGYSPSLGIPIGTALIEPRTRQDRNMQFYAEVRGNNIPITICKPAIARIRSMK